MKYNICVECNKEFGGRKKKYCSKVCSDDVRRRKNRERTRKVNPTKPDVTIICEWCSKEHTVPSRTAHQARFCSGRCKDMWWSRTVHKRTPIEDLNKQRDAQRLERKLKLKKARDKREALRSIVRTLKGVGIDKKKLELTRPCDECGIVFYDPNPIPLTCSKECSNKRRNRLGRLYMNDRYNEDNIIDRDITLEKLYERDEGVCYICGDECNYNDKVITDEGYFIVGKSYPSIDHVIPISKEGKHSWNNIKLAHHYCNTIKRDNIYETNTKTIVNS